MAATTSTASTPTDSSTIDTTTAEGEPPASAQVESVSVEAGDHRKVVYWWTPSTDYGEIESGDTSCTVVMTISNLGTGKVVDKQRSATCSLQGWHSAWLSQGRYKLAVAVALESGSKGSSSYSFTVVP